MTERYNSEVAKHYSAYRPPLHKMILSRVLNPDEFFQTGLDIGCGTGYSTIALTDYCGHVFGLDPNQPMLDEAQDHPKISYLQGGGDGLSAVVPHGINIVTFAGSLFYAKNEKLRAELIITCDPRATIVVYDFEILIGQEMVNIGVDFPPVNSDYDHATNISDWTGFAPAAVDRDQVALELSSEELAHVMLADSSRFSVLSESFQGDGAFAGLVDYYESIGPKHQLDADIYFARYQLSKP